MPVSKQQKRPRIGPAPYPAPQTSKSNSPDHSQELVDHYLQDTSPRRLSHLPPEVIAQCLDGLDQSALYQTSLLNRWGLAMSREMLYADLRLRSTAPHVQHTVKLLSDIKQRRMVMKIKKTVLETQTVDNGPWDWIPVDFFVGWRGLTVLELNGLPFNDPEQTEKFSTYITETCVNLTNLVVRPTVPCCSMLEKLQISPRGLTSIVLQYSPETSAMNIKPLLSGSQHRLTHLCFIGQINSSTCTPFHDMLRDTTFPSLTSFVAPLAYNGEYPRMVLSSQFIRRHMRLQHLSWGGCPIMDSSNAPSKVMECSAPRTDFPMIKALAICLPRPGTQGQIETLIRTVEDLDEVDLPSPFPANLHDPFIGLSSNSRYLHDETLPATPLRDVQFLKVEFEDDHSHQRRTNARPLDAEKAIIRMKQLCPNVTILELSLVCELDTLADKVLNAPSLQHLECLILPQLTILTPNNDESLTQAQQIDLFKKIASSCPQLKYIMTKKPPHSTFPDCIFTLTRDSTSEPSWPNFSQHLLSVEQKFMDDGLHYLMQSDIVGMEFVKSV